MRTAMLVPSLLLLVVALSYCLSGTARPVTPPARRAAMPPASRAERWRNRLRICSRRGHTYRVAFAPGYAHQCVDCGHVQRIGRITEVRA